MFVNFSVYFRIELTTPDTKKHKLDGIFKMIKTTQKNQSIIIVEFSFGRRAPLKKEDGDHIKLCRNSMRILNKLLQDVPKEKARVYMVQAVSKYCDLTKRQVVMFDFHIYI